MPMPPSVTRITKDGVEFTSSVDRCSYTIKELTRAALRDVGKFVVISANKKAQKLKGLSGIKSKKTKKAGKSMRVMGLNGSFQYWNRRREGDLQVGIKHETWYGVEQELGSSRMKKLGILSNTVHENIPTIIEIESKYLSALEDEAKALKLIEAEEHESGDEG